MSRRRGPTGVLVLALLAAPLTGCGSVDGSVPRCSATTRLALVAQSVPSAAYVPCVEELPAGWTVSRFDARRGETAFALLSDRAEGRRVEVRLIPRCETAGATPAAPRITGGRTYLRLRSIAPRYAGTLYDVFPGGCVIYGFDVARGPHIALLEEAFAMVELLPRRQLRLELRRELGQELDP